ncbi:hypothetical protein Barb7_02736 [Bacteroidales bacterium Barb7]|nr:hypothetical protein Barb7_02736 [Bacteroidales bacterium Barb7]
MSIIVLITSYISYALFGLSGIISFSTSSKRSIGSLHSASGVSSRLFCGRKLINLRISCKPSSSVSTAKWATPDLVVCTLAPPNSSCVTSSPVTVFTTFGPVRNI